MLRYKCKPTCCFFLQNFLLLFFLSHNFFFANFVKFLSHQIGDHIESLKLGLVTTKNNVTMSNALGKGHVIHVYLSTFQIFLQISSIYTASNQRVPRHVYL